MTSSAKPAQESAGKRYAACSTMCCRLNVGAVAAVCSIYRYAPTFFIHMHDCAYYPSMSLFQSQWPSIDTCSVLSLVVSSPLDLFGNSDTCIVLLGKSLPISL